MLAPAVAAGQTGTIVGAIVSRSSGEALPFGIVAIDGLGRSQFADDSGRFAFYQLAPGRYTVSVRRLGYAPRSVSAEVTADAADSVRVELDRIALRLGGITVRAHPPCIRPGAPRPAEDSTLAAIVGQIRLNAEQFRLLSREYPYAWSVLITRSAKHRRDGRVVPERGGIEQYDSRTPANYRPGQIIRRRTGGLYFQVPTLMEVADSSFVAAHCWHYAGTEELEDVELLRVDVVAFDSLRGPDVNGSFLLNPETFQIRRSILQLSQRPRNVPALLDMEVTTDFFEVLPSISIVSHVNSVQRMDPERRSPYVETYEEHRTTSFRFLGRKPGEGLRP